MGFIRKFFMLIVILSAITGFVLGMLYISHEMKPKRSEYQQKVAESGDVKKIFIVNHGWHSDVIIKMDDVSKFTLPEKRHFNGKKYIAIGWGDAGFYQATEITPELAARALLQPTETVVHMAGFNDVPQEAFLHSEVISLHVSKRGFDKMMEKLSASVVRYSMLSATPLRDGLHKNSYFFRGMGRYHMFNTCNHWTARLLKAAEVPFNVATAFTAKNVMWQTRRYAEDAKDSTLDKSMSLVEDKLDAFVDEYAQ